MEEGRSRISAPIILIIEFSLALLLAVYLLYKYGNLRKQNPFATGCTLVVWFLSFVIIFLLPVDVSSAFYHLCLDGINFTERNPNFNPSENVSLLAPDLEGSAADNPNIETCSGFVCFNKTFPAVYKNVCSTECFQPYTFVCILPLEVLWYIIYWLFFILSWVVLPLTQSYVLASYFSIWKKVLRALIENAIFYVTFLIIFLILFIYLVVVKHYVAFEKTPWLLATASNTWGLLILTLLLGYGLVEVPRTLWNASRRTYSLNHCYFRAAKLYTDMAEAEEKLKEVNERVSSVAQSLHYNDPLRKYVDIIIKKFPEDTQKEFSKGHDDYEDFRTASDPLTKSSLESLLKKTMKAVRLFKSTRIHWLALTDQTLDFEDVQLNSGSRLKRFQSSIRQSKDKWYNAAMEHLEWYWKLWIRPWCYRIGAVCLAVLSLVIVWCEVTFGIQNVKLSVFGQVVYTLHSYSNYIAVEALSIIVVAYLSICAYYTVFKIRIFNLYYLAPRHSTDEYSLLFSAVLLSRLALPICLNYLYVIQVVRLDQHDDEDNSNVPQTAFAFATGNTALIPWLTSYFYIYYPMLILLVCIATLFSVGTRLVSLLGYQKFIGEDDFSADYIDEGKTLMKRERRIRERNLREHGKAKPRDQLPFELLRESRSTGIDLYSKRRAERAAANPQTPLHEEEDQSRLAKFVGKAKGLAVKSKNTITTKYHSVRRKSDDDVIELLPSNSSSDNLRLTAANSISTSTISGGGRLTSRGGGPREPPRDIFDDL